GATRRKGYMKAARGSPAQRSEATRWAASWPTFQSSHRVGAAGPRAVNVAWRAARSCSWTGRRDATAANGRRTTGCLPGVLKWGHQRKEVVHLSDCRFGTLEVAGR